MPISGVLLTCEPERLAEVSESVNGRARSAVREVRGSTLIVVTDTESMRADRREVEALEAIEDLAETSPPEGRSS